MTYSIKYPFALVLMQEVTGILLSLQNSFLKMFRQPFEQFGCLFVKYGNRIKKLKNYIPTQRINY